LLDELRKRSIAVAAPGIDGLTLKDEGDRRLVEAAIAGGARYLVTSDREVLRYRVQGSTEFVTAGELLRTLGPA
jgi:predicted nucleic acid-binding protein